MGYGEHEGSLMALDGSMPGSALAMGDQTGARL
jgi:hypothetical protein